MKTIKELEEGCGKIIDNEYFGDTPLKDYVCGKKDICKECQATLTQTKEVLDKFKMWALKGFGMAISQSPKFKKFEKEITR